jgi:antirestriction protein ArdC
LTADLPKRVTQPAPSSHATSVASSVGVTGSSALSVAEAWNFCQRAAEFLEGLKNKEADQQGNPFTPSLFLSLDLFGWPTPFSICSVN